VCVCLSVFCLPSRSRPCSRLHRQRGRRTSQRVCLRRARTSFCSASTGARPDGQINKKFNELIEMFGLETWLLLEEGSNSCQRCRHTMTCSCSAWACDANKAPQSKLSVLPPPEALNPGLPSPRSCDLRTSTRACVSEGLTILGPHKASTNRSAGAFWVEMHATASGLSVLSSRRIPQAAAAAHQDDASRLLRVRGHYRNQQDTVVLLTCRTGHSDPTR
jgi:hypothetical protein